MEFITEVYDASQEARRFTAPSGKMYLVHVISVTSIQSSTTQFVISNRYFEEDADYIGGDSGVFFAYDGTIDGGNMVVSLPKPLKMKTITMGARAAGNLHCIVTIFYELEKASLPDLIYEFISRGKNP